jgi:cysteinyl-tRNA synthetase
VSLSLYNTLSASKEAFEPLEASDVRMYVCGPTVYDRAHIGNARPAVVFDVLYRLLRLLYGDRCVRYIRNITDVDDKIIEAHRRSGEAIDEITGRTIRAYHEDMAALNCLPPSLEPRATEHIDDMMDLVQRLIDSGHAYVAERHVLFEVARYRAYGRLARRDADAMMAGARVEVAPYKRAPADFVLWKPALPEEPGWDSPWGRGRPGWHIECSAMSCRYLGHSFDIHGGGQDLIFPHHENEIAQSMCAHPDQSFARYWMHNGFLMTEGEKMSKSLGNFYTVDDLLQEFPGEAIRLALLQTHYRQPLDFTRAGVAKARQALDRAYGALRSIDGVDLQAAEPPREVRDALCDDLNTPQALSVFYGLVSELHKAQSPREAVAAKARLLAAGGVLGLLHHNPEQWLHSAGQAGTDVATDEIDRMIVDRNAARSRRDFARADAIRAELSARGIALEDRPEGTVWRRA